MILTLLKNVKVGVLQEDGTGKEMSIGESPYYRALAEFDRRHFDDYRCITAKVSGTPLDEMRWFTFAQMAQDIERRGFIVRNPRIRFTSELVALDGHHRLAILLYIYGPELGLQIENNELCAIWVKSNKS